jgi:hypothetical protein
VRRREDINTKHLLIDQYDKEIEEKQESILQLVNRNIQLEQEMRLSD